MFIYFFLGFQKKANGRQTGFRLLKSVEDRWIGIEGIHRTYDSSITKK